MTLDERCKKHRAEAMRYKRKYLVLKHRIMMLSAAVDKIALGKWYCGRTDGKADNVVLVDDVKDLINKCLSEVSNED